jgi:alpha-amylase/alpha-mannosidase (GH57 family)
MKFKILLKNLKKRYKYIFNNKDLQKIIYKRKFILNEYFKVIKKLKLNRRKKL